MNIFLDKSYRIYIIILAAITALVLYIYVINPYIFKPLCLTDSENCYKIKYKLGSNGDALINVSPGNNWYVYSDYKIYVYTPYDDKYCKEGDDNFSPVYVIDTQNGGNKSKGDNKNYTGEYKCILNLNNMIKNYEGIPEKTLYYRSKDKNGNVKPLNVYDIFNILYKHEILY